MPYAVEQAAALAGSGQLALREEGEVVGDAMVETVAGSPHAVEIGVTLAPAAQGRGLATEAVVALVDAAFASGRARAIAYVDVRNEPSQRLFDRAGFRREGLLHHSYQSADGLVDEVLFAATADRWAPAGGRAGGGQPVRPSCRRSSGSAEPWPPSATPRSPWSGAGPSAAPCSTTWPRPATATSSSSRPGSWPAPRRARPPGWSARCGRRLDRTKLAMASVALFSRLQRGLAVAHRLAPDRQPPHRHHAGAGARVPTGWSRSPEQAGLEVEWLDRAAAGRVGRPCSTCAG